LSINLNKKKQATKICKMNTSRIWHAMINFKDFYLLLEVKISQI